jgi:CHAD domain-containing protein
LQSHRGLAIVFGVKSTSAAFQHRAQVLFSKLEKVIDQIESEPTPETVHQLRTTIRRIETLLTAAGRAHDKLIKQLSRLRRRAGKVRNLDVQTAALRGIRLEAVRRDKTSVLRALSKTHSKRVKKLAKALEEELAAGLAKRMKRAPTELETGRSHRRQPKDFTAIALDSFAKLVQDQPPLTTANLHDFRMACKRVRYVAEMADSPRSAAVVAQLQRIQDAIGEWHDWLTLTETANEVLSTPTSPLLSVLRATRQSKFSESLRIVNEVKDALLPLGAPMAPKKQSQSIRHLTATARHAQAGRQDIPASS